MSDRLAPEDLARLRMGMRENPMVITAALLLSERLERAALIALLEERLLCHERFRKRVVEPRLGSGSPRWEDVPGFDVRDHCVWHAASTEGVPLVELVEACVNEPLAADRPLWRLTVLDGVEGGSALVFRVHHVIADGEALVGVLGALSDEGGGAPPAPAPCGGQAPAGRLLRLLGGIAGAVPLVLRPRDPATALHRRLGVDKRVGCSSPLALAELSARAHARGVTVTELLLAAVAAALRERLAPGADLTVHALVPVSLRGPAGAEGGNHYASVFVTLPLGDLTPDERVRRVAQGLRAARSRGALGAAAHLVGASSAASRRVERFAVMLFSRRASVVVSSVRGPPGSLHVGGARLSDVLVWAPAPGSIALAVTLMSYAGHARVGVVADAKVVGDPAPIVAALERDLGAPAHRE